MKKTLKLGILVVIAILLIQFIPYNEVFAEVSGNYTYSILENGTICITKYNGTESVVTVPSTIDEKKVTEIGIMAFSSNSNITKIILPYGLLKLDAYSFDSCSNLTTVEMPDSLTFISNIFKDACPKLTNYTIPASLTKLSENGDWQKVAYVNISGTYNYDKAKEVADLVNQEREKVGLSPLIIDNSLTESAMQRAAELSIYWDHERPNGLSCFSVNKKINGENIGVGSSSTSNIMNSWMNSVGHKAQIVSSRYNSIGIGCYSFGGLTYWVQLFSTINSENTNILSGKKDVNNTVQVATDKLNIVLKGIEENNILEIGETLAPTSVKNKNAGYSYAQTPIAFSDLTWSTSNINVFTVDKNGTVTAIGEGEAILTASIGDFSATYNIKVNGNVPIEEITLNKTYTSLEEGESEKLIATILPEDTTDDKTIAWTSSDESVATVDNNGNVKAIHMGVTTIAATTTNGKVAECNVQVTELVYTTIPTTDVSEKEIMTFKSKTDFKTILTQENFPIFDKNYKVELYNTSDNVKDNNEKIGSKNIIKIKNTEDKVVAEYTMVVKGDVTGNGFSRMYDAFQILKDSLFSGKLDEIDMLIRDYDGNGYVRMYDAFQFLKDSLFN